MVYAGPVATECGAYGHSAVTAAMEWPCAGGGVQPSSAARIGCVHASGFSASGSIATTDQHSRAFCSSGSTATSGLHSHPFNSHRSTASDRQPLRTLGGSTARDRQPSCTSRCNGSTAIGCLHSDAPCRDRPGSRASCGRPARTGPGSRADAARGRPTHPTSSARRHAGSKPFRGHKRGGRYHGGGGNDAGGRHARSILVWTCDRRRAA